MTKGIVYYTDNSGDINMRRAVYKQLVRAADSIPIVCVSWLPFPCEWNIVTGKGKRGNSNVHKQIVIGAKALKSDVIFMAEHDVLYHKSHFAFTPEDRNIRYFNENKWRLRLDDGATVFLPLQKGRIAFLSQMVAHTDAVIDHYTKERFVNKRKFMSHCPNIDIRHANNYTRNRAFSKPSVLAHGVPFWGSSKKIMAMLEKPC